MQAGLILVAEQTGTIVKTYAGSNRLHTVHPPTPAFDAYVHTYTHVSHFAGIEMAATDLSPIYHRTHGNACTYIYVYEVFGNLSESPDAFGSCSALHIIVYMARHAIYVRQFLCQLNPLCPARVNLQPDTFVGIYTPYQANTHRYRFLVIPAHGTDIIIERRLDDFQRSLLIKVTGVIFLIPQNVATAIHFANQQLRAS